LAFALGCGSEQGENAFSAGGASFGGGGSGSVAGATAGLGSGGISGETEAFVFGVPPAASIYFKRGINLGNRLEGPNEGDWGGTILATDFPFIAARGFDHVRIPIRFSGHALASAPYTIDSTFFARVDTVIEQALAANLAVLIDLHAYDELDANPSGQRDRFLAIWTQLAERYQGLPETVAFELLNEPYDQLDTGWNQLFTDAAAAVRITNPRRLLVADSVFWADPAQLRNLVLPNDANIMAALHLYEPKLFSFQGQSWMSAEFRTAGVIFPGPPATPIVPVQAAQDASWAAQWFNDYNTLPAATNPSGPATVDAQIAKIVSYRDSSGRTVYNGEWGPQDGGDDDSRARLISVVRERCETAGIGWAIWEDPKNMSLFDSTAGTWNTKLVDALLPP
jgi:endoglucanase